MRCALCGNPYRRAAGACDNCGQSGESDWDALAAEARSLRVRVFGGFGLALLMLVLACGVFRGAVFLFIFPFGFGAVRVRRLLAIERLLRDRSAPNSF